MSHWPTREESLANLRIGAWYTCCCYEDFYEVENEEDVEFLRAELTEKDPCEQMGYVVWPSRKEGLLALRDGEPPENRAKIDAELASDTLTYPHHSPET